MLVGARGNACAPDECGIATPLCALLLPRERASASTARTRGARAVSSDGLPRAVARRVPCRVIPHSCDVATNRKPNTRVTRPPAVTTWGARRMPQRNATSNTPPPLCYIVCATRRAMRESHRNATSNMSPSPVPVPASRCYIVCATQRRKSHRNAASCALLEEPCTCNTSPRPLLHHVRNQRALQM